MDFTSEEIQCLGALSSNQVSFQELSESLGLNIDSVRRAIAILQEKGLVDVKKEEASSYKLSKFGNIYLKEPFPEEQILTVLSDDKMLLSNFRSELGDKSAFLFGYAMKNKLIEVQGEYVIKTSNLKDFGFSEYHDALQTLSQGEELTDKKLIDNLLKMNLLEVGFKSEYFVNKNSLGESYTNLEQSQTITYLTSDMLKTGEYKNIKFKPYNVVSEVEPLNIGKYQPYARFLTLIKNKLVSIGFEEMPTDLITTEFYNFDIPFQPQNHPARTWTDTYSLKRPAKGELPDKKIVDAVKNAHENGGITGSKGWNYNWSEEIAKRLMPAAHGTAYSARILSQGVIAPKKYFALSRVYRPDVLDATHLSEFNQLEGIVVGKVNFKNLLGLLEQFAKEIGGAEEIMFTPCYYPFTEPSVSLHAKHPKLGWVELGGAGIFRPEFTETLGYKEDKVLAWGLGIDRLAMFNLGLTDIRDLFSSKIELLRSKPIVEKV